MMRLPVSVAPVKPTLRITGLRRISSPTAPPGPVTMLMVPLGSPACCTSSTHRVAVSGVVLAGLMTMALPASRAGPTLLPMSETGKFHGTMEPTTPMGLCMMRP